VARIQKNVVPNAPVQGEHIFAASYLEPLAIKWKELNEKGKHTEAMAVLEEIVVGSTQMFQRLAQHEYYHYTVHLDVLVAAAQEKVIKWLIRWERKKGRLFTWFSKSYCGDNFVILSDGTARTIADIVDDHLAVNVLSWNRSTGQFEAKPIIAWFKEPVEDLTIWRRLHFKQPGSEDSKREEVILTNDHEVYTDRGLVRVDELNTTDQLCVAKPEITPDGMSALIGMYLGDGSITRSRYFVVTHGSGQQNYTKHAAQKFGNQKVWFNRVRLPTGKKTYYTWKTNLPLKRIWPNCPLTERKSITEWLLDNITPVALAYWYMDHGSLSKNRYQQYIPAFCCECFSLKDQNRIMERLWFDWGLRLLPQHYKGEYRLIVLATSVERFFDYIRPYLLPCFEHKIPTNYQIATKKDIELVRYRDVYTADFKVTPASPRKPKEKERLRWKYDITVADNHNVVVTLNGKTQNGVASGLCTAQCAKNAFRSELVKENNFRDRFHTTSDNLEKFYPSLDHEIDKHDLAAEVRANLTKLTCRWGNPQEIGAIHFLIECILEEDHDKASAVRGAACAWGISMELSKFFYSQSLVMLRDQMYKRIRVPFTEEDIIRLAYSYTDFVSLFDASNTPLVWNIHGKYLCAVLGGKRIKIPTIAQISALLEAKQIFDEIDASDKDPESIAEIATRHGKSSRTAQEIFTEMSEILDPRRSGEYDIFGDDHHLGQV
jgi:LAGLIDADG DNA endonuclease family